MEESQGLSQAGIKVCLGSAHPNKNPKHKDYSTQTSDPCLIC